MDVRCDRCGTEYEFDDALISERGTTVKCTNCGHQFRIFPPASSARPPERWVVRTAQGRELVFTSLRDLQRGIAQRQIGPNDLLSRGNQPPRPLGSIAELEPFFRSMDAPDAERAPRTMHGVAPPANPAAQPAPVPSARRPSPVRLEGGPGIAARVGGEVAPSGSAARGLAASPLAYSATVPGPGQPTLPVYSPSEPGGLAQPSSSSRERVAHSADATAPSHPPTRPAQDLWSPPGGFPQPERGRSSVAPPSRPSEPAQGPPSGPSPIYEALKSELDLAEYTTPHQSRWPWVLGLVAAAAIVLGGVTFGRSYLRRAAPAAETPGPDKRVLTMIEHGQALANEGDFEAAKEELDKASALADQNPLVRTALARLEVVRADLLWQKLRLLGADENVTRDTRALLARRLTKAREAVARLSGKDAVVTRLRVDVARIAGEFATATTEAGALAAEAEDPKNAYTLAMLSLAQTDPPPPEVLERLQKAARDKDEAIRARPALIALLARTADVQGAQNELATLKHDTPAHPLTAELEAQIVKSSLAAHGDDARERTVTPVAAEKPAKAEPVAAAAARADAPSGDFRAQLAQAGKALGAGDLNRAERLYKAVLASHPGNTEALAGLGDVAHRRKDTTTAEQMYERALKDNPSYLPALMASADQKWERGDRKGAIALYRRVLEQAEPSSAYGQRAAARIALGEQAPAPAPAPKNTAPEPSGPPEPSPPSSSPPPESPAPSEPPQIDRSDLPEEKP